MLWLIMPWPQMSVPAECMHVSGVLSNIRITYKYIIVISICLFAYCSSYFLWKGCTTCAAACQNFAGGNATASEVYTFEIFWVCGKLLPCRPQVPILVFDLTRQRYLWSVDVLNVLDSKMQSFKDRVEQSKISKLARSSGYWSSSSITALYVVWFV